MAIKLAEERHRRVSEVMSEAVGVIEESATAGEAKTILVDLEVTGAPVVRGEQVLGVVSRADLLRADDATPVTEIMSDPVYAVRPGDSLALAVRLMVKQRIHRVVVVNEAGELRGILTALDALAAVADSLGPTGDIAYASLAPPEE
ncbi:MAG: CBS domain-containing protein [Myxococcales bacterium]|nr:CBS domain-containing protein [Myxococcales bacterium]